MCPLLAGTVSSAEEANTGTSLDSSEPQCVRLRVSLLGLGPDSATCCLMLGKLLNHFVPQFSHLSRGII